MNNPLIGAVEVATLNSGKKRMLGFLNRALFFLLGKAGRARYHLFRNQYVVQFPEEQNLTLRLPMDGDFERSLNLYDQREVLHRALIAQSMKSGIINAASNIIDSGPANGDCALVWALMVSGKVYAIDPSENNLRYIQKTAALNHINNIVSINCALGDTNGWLYPLYDVDHTPFTEAPLTALSQRKKVKARTLDSMKEDGSLKAIGYIHLDVEGMELNVIRGARELLKADRPVLTFEAHLSIDPIHEIFDILRCLEYKIFMINEVTAGGRPDCVNFMCLQNNAQLDAAIGYLNAVTPVSAFYKATVGGNLIQVD